ncbi:TadE/TadG family type IV pilus assembly protein [Anatilimnocola sp. NA78]|uniref:TadE/TadG family type IV pilus assembly protein n=1 Tax=Anatilimnocola sp. NA78 TaxID=3415683 RepID=UPI003CE52BAB
MKPFGKACRSIRRRSRLGAVLSIELIMVLPILLIVLLAMVEFGILLMSSQGVGAAAAVGSRNAALPSSSRSSVAAAVNTALSGYIWKNKTELVVYVDADGNGPGDFVEDTAIPGTLLANAPSGAIVSVTVNLPMDDAAPNLLRYFGIDLAGKELTTTYVTRKE